MRLRLANLRLGQHLYTLPYIKDLFHVVSSHLPPTFRDKVTIRGLESIWSPTYEDVAQKYRDINDIISLIRLNGGSSLLFKTISYLDDRFVKTIHPTFLSLDMQHVVWLVAAGWFLWSQTEK